MEVQLIVNNEPLDLKENERIPLVLQAQSFTKLSDKVGGFSRSFTVPMTDKNKRLLNYTNEFNYDTDFPYNEHRAYIVCNGIELQPGKILVENDGVSEDEIRITYYTGNSPFFQLINQLKLKQICLGDGNHLFSWNEIAYNPNSINYFYPIIDYTGSALTFNGSVRDVFYENLYPAQWLYRAIEGIEKLTGYTFKGKIFTSDDFLKMFFPTSEEFERDTNYEVRNTWETQRTTQENIFNGGIYDLTVDELVLSDTYIDVTNLSGSFLKLASGTGLCGNTIIPQANTSTIRNLCLMFSDTVRLNFEITGLIGLSVGFSTARVIAFQWVEFITNRIPKEVFTNDPNSGAGQEYYGNPLNATIEIWNTGGSYGGSPQTVVIGGSNYYYLISDGITIPVAPAEVFNLRIKFDIDVKAHVPYYMRLSSTFDFCELNDLKCKVSFVEDKGTTNEDRQIKLLDMNKNDWSRSLVSGTTPLPNIKISDFLRNLANQFNCIVISSDEMREVEFITMQELYENTPNANDWSAKIVNPKAAKWNTRANGYGEKSRLKYENEDGVNPLLGEYVMGVNDTTLPDEVDIIKVGYSATEMRTTEDGVGYAYIQRVEDNKYSKGKQRVLYSNYLTSGFPSGIVNIRKKNNPALGGPTYSLNTGFIPMCYFNQANQPRQLGFDSYLFREYYRQLEYITDKYKQLTVELLLDATDINRLDFSIPVYLSQYSGYFYVEKINDWVPGKPCKVTLLKLQ